MRKDLGSRGERRRRCPHRSLATHGAVVIRGLLAPNSTAQEFSDINYTLADYVGGVTLRPDYAPKVTPVSSVVFGS